MTPSDDRRPGMRGDGQSVAANDEPIIAPTADAPLPAELEAEWFVAGLTTGEHLAATLGGTFADGYDAGHADGYRDGYDARAAELEAQQAAVWAEVGPRVEASTSAAHNRAVADARWAKTFAGTTWDAERERERAMTSWAPLDLAAASPRGLTR